MDIHKIKDNYRIIDEINPVTDKVLINTFEVNLKLDLPLLYIQVWKIKGGIHYPQPNYWFRFNGVPTPYSFHPKDCNTIEESISEIINRGMQEEYDSIDYSINSAFYEHIGAPIPNTLNRDE